MFGDKSAKQVLVEPPTTVVVILWGVGCWHIVDVPFVLRCRAFIIFVHATAKCFNLFVVW